MLAITKINRAVFITVADAVDEVRGSDPILDEVNLFAADDVHEYALIIPHLFDENS